MAGTCTTHGQHKTHKDSSTLDTARAEKEGTTKRDMEENNNEQEMKPINQTWNGLGRLAQDRGDWRTAVKALCTDKCEED